jgi:hypothetical protein
MGVTGFLSRRVVFGSVAIPLDPPPICERIQLEYTIRSLGRGGEETIFFTHWQVARQRTQLGYTRKFSFGPLPRPGFHFWGDKGINRFSPHGEWQVSRGIGVALRQPNNTSVALGSSRWVKQNLEATTDSFSDAENRTVTSRNVGCAALR